MWVWLVLAMAGKVSGGSRPHSYIFLRNNIYRGKLLAVKSDGSYCNHTHRIIFTKGYSFRFTADEVAALTEEECVILDGISSDANRFIAYNTTGKLKWGCGLKVGDTLLARLPGISGRGSSGEQHQYTTAIIRWRGQTAFGGHKFGVEITDKKYRGHGDTDGTHTSVEGKYFSCEDKCGLFLTLDTIEQPPHKSVPSIAELQDQNEQLEKELRERTQEIHHLQRQLQEDREQATKLQREARDTVLALQEELRQKDQEMTQNVTRFEERLVEQRETHVIELQHVREQYEHQLNEVQHGGEAVAPQLLNLWELPREDVHISQTILGTGGWGYVARGTFRGQVVAVKCLHRGILSPQNEGRVRREISIMAQVRHPNLLLLIGAVLSTEGAGPLIITELLDGSLRSAYEANMLEEKSKVPILRDVASALTYLHSHRTPIIHRDVSSANVLLEETKQPIQWKAKLSDFGSANLIYLATTPFEGAAVYSAPEVNTEDRSQQTAKIDVYSFGVLVCEVALCRFPPDRDQFPYMLRDVHHATPDMFPLVQDCTNHAHQDRPAMSQVLERINQIRDKK